MRRLLLVVLLAGCTQVAPADDPAPLSDPAILTECVLAKPDGSSACEGSEFAAPLSTSRPSLLDGWKCTNRWEEGSNVLELYVTVDGRVGMYWEWQRWKADGLPFQRLGWYDSSGGESVHVPFQPTGFVALSGVKAPEDTVEIHTTLRHLRVHAQVDGEWIQPENITFIVDSFGGDTWWSVRFDWEGGPYYLSTMNAQPEEGRRAVWEGPGWQGVVAGVPVIVDHLGAGNKYVGVDFTTRRASPSSCGLT